MTLTGKICVITGANSGLGLATAKLFAREGARVVMVCRNRERAEAAAADIRREYPTADLELASCDLTSLASIRSFIQSYESKHDGLDVLFNNAAIVQTARSVTEDGFDTMFQTNYLAPFLLSTGLLGSLQKRPGARIIIIAVPPRRLRLDFSDLQARKLSAFRSLFAHKLCLLFHSLELARRLSGTSVSLFVTDPGPGSFRSNISRDLPWLLRKLVWLFAKPTTKAAETIGFLASSPELAGASGSVFAGRNPVLPEPYWQDVEVSQRLWQETAVMLGLGGELAVTTAR